jgi:hypothetical protein
MTIGSRVVPLGTTEVMKRRHIRKPRDGSNVVPGVKAREPTGIDQGA